MRETGDSKYIYQNEVDKAYFQRAMAYGDFMDSPRRTIAEKILRDKTFNIAENSKYNGYHRQLASIAYKFFDKKTFNTNKGTGSNSTVVSKNKELAKELRETTISKFIKRKSHSHFIDNIWVADLADLWLLSRFNKGIRFLLCVIDIFGKYAWVFSFRKRYHNY